jgi:hypothetical protein
MFDFSRANKGRVRTMQAALPLMGSHMLVDIKKYSFGVRVVERIKLQKNIQHGKNLNVMYTDLQKLEEWFHIIDLRPTSVHTCSSSSASSASSHSCFQLGI